MADYHVAIPTGNALDCLDLSTQQRNICVVSFSYSLLSLGSDKTAEHEMEWYDNDWSDELNTIARLHG